jgi:hypothetical protein
VNDDGARRTAYRKRGEFLEGRAAERRFSVRCARCVRKQSERAVVLTAYLIDGVWTFEALRSVEWGLPPDVERSGIPFTWWVVYEADESPLLELFCRDCGDAPRMRLDDLVGLAERNPNRASAVVHASGLLTL